MDEKEYMNLIIKQIQKMNEFEKKERIANEENRNKIDELVDFVNSIFKKHNIKREITQKHIRFYADFIGNILYIEDKLLSHIIFDKYFPKPNKNTYYHYTSFNNAKELVSNKTLKLYNLIKRFSDGEFTTFYEVHGMDGYKKGETVLGIDCSNEAIMSEIFYFSLTGSGTGSLYNSLWKDFGDDGYGVRLEFEIIPQTDDFRKVFYPSNNTDKHIPLLKDMFESIKNKYGKPFNFTYSSKIGAFYIKGKYQTENEYRFIIKRTSDDYGAYYLQPTKIDDNNNVSYIEVPFENEFAIFKLKSIQPGYNCEDDDINEIKNWIEKYNEKPDILNKAHNEEY